MLWSGCWCPEQSYDSIYQRKTYTTDPDSNVGWNAAKKQSIHSIRSSLSSVSCETFCRCHIANLNREDLEEEASSILLDLPNSIFKSGKSYTFAIDYTDDPYYGEIKGENTDFVRRTEANTSTTRFYTYVTLYAIQVGKRVTLPFFRWKIRNWRHFIFNVALISSGPSLTRSKCYVSIGDFVRLMYWIFSKNIASNISFPLL